jgi:hypothetical protein
VFSPLSSRCSRRAIFALRRCRCPTTRRRACAKARSVSRALIETLQGTVRIVKSNPALGREGFSIASQADGSIAITGGDDSGVLYGCLELARRAKDAKQLPADIKLTDKPAMVLRGPCIGMQKTTLLPGHRVYEYPYTPESFPFFYDKQFWTAYLDFLADNRFNTLYLWNGHPSRRW